MKLIRIIALQSLQFNRKVVVRYVWSVDNMLSDLLSRFQMPHFWKHAAPTMACRADQIIDLIQPITRIWISNNDYLNHF